MGMKTMLWAYEQDDVSSEAKFLLVTLAVCLNEETGQCNPSQQLLSKRLKKSLRTIKRLTDELRQNGKIFSDKSGWRGTNNYSFPDVLSSATHDTFGTSGATHDTTQVPHMTLLSSGVVPPMAPLGDYNSATHDTRVVPNLVNLNPRVVSPIAPLLKDERIIEKVIERKTPQTPHGGQDGFFGQPEIEVENPAVVVPTKTETRKKSDRLDELFELFYKLYPKKPSGPKNSKRSWKRIVTTETLANQIIDNVRERLVKDIKWVEAIASGDKTYICAPEVFLNQERWLGEYTKVGSIKPVGGNGRYDQNYEPDDGGGIQQFIPPPKDTRTPEEKAAEQRQIDIEREAVKKRMLERNMSKDAIPF